MLIRRIVVAIVVSLALVTQVLPAGAASPPISIPVVLSLSGSQAFLGMSEQAIVKAFEGSINAHGGVRGRPVRFEFLDDQSSPQIAVQLANRIIGERAAVFLGTTITATSTAIAPLITNGPVMYSYSPAFKPDSGSYGFAASVRTGDNLTAIVRAFRNHGWKKLALLTTIDASGQDGERAFKDIMALPENHEMSLVANEHLAPADISVSAQMVRIKESKPDAIIAWAPGSPFVQVVHAYTDAGLDIPLGTTTANMTYPQMRAIHTFNDKKIYFGGFRFFERRTIRPGPLKDRVDEFYRAIGALKIKPDGSAGNAWDPALLVTSALQKYGADATATQIRDYILSQKSFVGIDGVYNFSDGSNRGLTAMAVTLMHWEPGRDEWLPASAAGGYKLGSR